LAEKIGGEKVRALHSLVSSLLSYLISTFRYVCMRLKRKLLRKMKSHWEKFLSAQNGNAPIWQNINTWHARRPENCGKKRVML